ncbi:MAG: hypothetical protein M3Q29_16795 [Chloroflexota bacterium]|nr:hypothetical protein [Chloroflexota bacterium]
MARRIAALAAIGLLALATICLLSSFVLGVSPLDLSMPVFEPDSTPEEAVRRSVCAQGVPRNFRVHGTRSWERGVIVLFSADCPSPPDAPIPEPEIPVSGFRLLQDGLFGWRVVIVGSAADGKEARSGQLVSYRPGGGRGGRLGSYGYVSGRVLAPDKVRAVEAIFDNGRVMRDDAPGELFALFSLGTGGPCELRTLDKDGRILQRFDLVGEARRFGEINPELATMESGGWGGVSMASPELCRKHRKASDRAK